ncbi:MAG TPA: murein L,D-transpeptidase catalytic domain family protein [Thermoanaerobaculia bacterium]|nr:murein L,D-transpeptidase catalytic domain family protein [Thermoanaerobaculia bacterium]
MKRLFLAIAIAFVGATNLLAAPDALVTTLVSQAPGLRADVLRLALDAAGSAAKRGLVGRRNLLTVIDYSLPSSQKRLFVFDLAAKKLLFHELVAHGKNSGGNIANFFSNDPGSEATSLGLFVTQDTYVGHNGYSLRLRGLDEGVNDMASERAIVLHGAYYVSLEAVRVLGRLGRSWGCPAVRSEIAQKLIDTIRGGSAIFAYYPDRSWLSNSVYLRHALAGVGRKDSSNALTSSR